MGDIVLVLIFAVIALLNVAATIAAVRDEYAEPRQKVLQIMFVWIIPLCGALAVLSVHRKPEKPSGIYRRANDGLGDDCGTQRPFVKSFADVLDDD
ncbi:MAG: hypothetical protein WKG03_16760 [Telluria sp.]